MAWNHELFPLSKDDVFERHFPDETVDQVFQITAPPNKYTASTYRQALEYVNSVARPIDNYRPFYSPKKDGTNRLIFGAEPEMALVHSVLTRWMIRNLPLAQDYCYTRGGGVKAAISDHTESRYGYVFDLEKAFLHVTDSMLAKTMSIYLPKEKHPAIPMLAFLMTVQGKVRQGTRCAPYAYNLAVKPLHDALSFLCKGVELVPGVNLRKNPILKFSRYSDNCIYSSPQPIDFQRLASQVDKFAKVHGFDLSWSEIYDNKPIVYLGTSFYNGEILLDPETIDKYEKFLEMALTSGNPVLYKEAVTRRLSWLLQVCGTSSKDKRITNLLNRFEEYFRIARTPERFADDVFSKTQGRQNRLL